ncbi:hypothetical protein GCM10018965_022010 [Nonomuraea roseola]
MFPRRTATTLLYVTQNQPQTDGHEGREVAPGAPSPPSRSNDDVVSAFPPLPPDDLGFSDSGRAWDIPVACGRFRDPDAADEGSDRTRIGTVARARTRSSANAVNGASATHPSSF